MRRGRQVFMLTLVLAIGAAFAATWAALDLSAENKRLKKRLHSLSAHHERLKPAILALTEDPCGFTGIKVQLDDEEWAFAGEVLRSKTGQDLIGLTWDNGLVMYAQDQQSPLGQKLPVRIIRIKPDCRSKVSVPSEG